MARAWILISRYRLPDHERDNFNTLISTGDYPDLLDLYRIIGKCRSLGR